MSLDAIAHEVLEPGSEVLRDVAREFGVDVISPDGSLNRAALAEIAFACHECAERLNAIVHPAVVKRVRALLQALVESDAPPPVVVLEIPLLAEVPELCDVADHVLAISAPEEERVARAVARGMDETDARHRIACQATDDERAALATRVIVNDGDEAHFRAALEAYARELLDSPASMSGGVPER